MEGSVICQTARMGSVIKKSNLRQVRINDVTYVTYFVSLLVYSKCSIDGTYCNHLFSNDSKEHNWFDICFFHIFGLMFLMEENEQQTGSLPTTRETSGTIDIHESLNDQNEKDKSHELFLRSILRSRRRLNKFLKFQLVFGLRKWSNWTVLCQWCLRELWF